MFFSIHCVIVGGGGEWGGVVEDKKGASFWRGPPPRGLWLRSAAAAAAAPRVRQRRTASKRKGHTQKSAQLCACAWLEGGKGGCAWFCGVGEERMGGFGGGRRREGKKDTHRE